MELKPGYKQTEVGVIPEDWDALPAREIGFFKGGSGFPLKAQGETHGDYPFFKVSDMNNEGNETFMMVGNHYISENTRKQLGATAFPENSIVFAKVGAAIFLERKKILGQPSCIDNNMTAFVLDNSRADVRYMHSLLLSKKLGALVATTALPALNGKQLGEMPLAVPPLPEQRAIATALSDVDALLDGLDRLIAKNRDLKQAAMQQLLTGKTRLPGFEGEWEVKRISELLCYERPDRFIVKSSEYEETGSTPVLTANKSFILGYTYEDFGVYFNLPVIIFDDFTTDSKYVDFPFKVKSSAIKILKTSNLEVNLKFIFERMRLIKFPLGEHKRYYISEYQSIELLTPKLDEQTAITQVLSDMDAEIVALEQRRNKTKDIKQAMMQELLTGKTRLVTPGGSNA